jgi:hypothetical protein
VPIDSPQQSELQANLELINVVQNQRVSMVNIYKPWEGAGSESPKELNEYLGRRKLTKTRLEMFAKCF